MDRNNIGNLNAWFDISMVETSDAKFAEMFDMSVESAMVFGIGKTSMPPLILVHVRPFLGMGQQALGDTELMVICVDNDFNESDIKKKICNQIGAKMRAEKVVPVAIFFTAEAWMSRQEQSSDMTMPSEDPNRMECIIVAGRTLGGDCKAMQIIEVTRDTENNMQRGKHSEKMTDPKRIQTTIVDHIFDGFIDQSIKLNPEVFREINTDE